MGDATQVMGEKERQVAQQLSERPLYPPSRIPGYEQERFLGRGAFGEVWMAVNSNVGKRVAIKFYSRRGGLDWSLLSREVEKLSYLFHDRYVVQLLEVGWEAEPPYYIMEFMENGSLEDWLVNRTLPVVAAAEVFQDIATGLVHAHGKGILHCDLKPANILLDQDFKPRLADFGQSRLTHEHAPALGTLFYMAPEQADLKGSPDARWDVFALGAILYRMLTGVPPYRTKEAVEAFGREGSLDERLRNYRENIRKAPPPSEHYRVRGIDRNLVQIIDRCLKVKPQDRFPNVQAVLNALQERRRTLARRPMLIMGMVAPALVVLIMAIFAAVLLNKMIGQSVTEITRMALESDLFAAEAVAKQMALAIDRRWRILEYYASQPEFRDKLAEFQQAPPNSAARTDIEKWMKKWLKLNFESSNKGFLKEDRAQSWFVNAKTKGIQVARFPSNAATKDKEMWFRDYFNGLGENIPDPIAYLKKHNNEIPGPIQKPHRSAVYLSKATSTYAVAFSVPVWSELPDEDPSGDDPKKKEPKKKVAKKPEVIGVLGMSMQIGSVHLNRESNDVGALLDIRKSEQGKSGLIISHPNLLPSAKEYRTVAPDVVDRAVKLQTMVFEYLRESDAAAHNNSPLWKPEGKKLALMPKYQDPLDWNPPKDWLAAMCPVVVYRGSGADKIFKTDLVVLDQEPRDALAEPINGLHLQLLVGLGIAVASVFAVIVLLLWFMSMLFDESRQSRLVTYFRRRLGLATLTPSASSVSAARQTPLEADTNALTAPNPPS